MNYSAVVTAAERIADLAARHFPPAALKREAEMLLSLLRRLDPESLFHCWAIHPTDRKTCVLRRDHPGPHAYTPDAQIVVRLDEE